MKNWIIVLFSFVMGVVLGLFVFDGQGQYHSEVQSETSAIVSSDSNLLDTSSLDQNDLENTDQSLLIKQIEKLTDEVKSLKKASTKSEAAQNENEEVDITESLSPEILSLARTRLADLKQTQPYELKDIFKDDPKVDNQRYENPYYEHLAQEKDNDWAYKAENFIRNYLAKPENSYFKTLRIDCRSSSCEVAGLVKIPDELIERNTLARENKDSRVFIDSHTKIMEYFMDITIGIIYEEGYNGFLDVRNSYSSYLGANYILENNPYAHSFIIFRANP